MIEWWTCNKITMRISKEVITYKVGDIAHGMTIESMKVNDCGMLCIHFLESEDAILYKPDSFVMNN